MKYFIPFVALQLPLQAQFMVNGTKLYESEGRLATVRVVPGDKSAKLYIVGKKAAQLDAKKDAQLLSVTSLVDGKPEELHFTADGTAYTIERFPQGKNVSLDVRTSIRGEPDNVKLNFDRK